MLSLGHVARTALEMREGRAHEEQRGTCPSKFLPGVCALKTLRDGCFRFLLAEVCFSFFPNDGGKGSQRDQGWEAGGEGEGLSGTGMGFSLNSQEEDCCHFYLLLYAVFSLTKLFPDPACVCVFAYALFLLEKEKKKQTLSPVARSRCSRSGWSPHLRRVRSSHVCASFPPRQGPI